MDDNDEELVVATSCTLIICHCSVSATLNYFTAGVVIWYYGWRSSPNYLRQRENLSYYNTLSWTQELRSQCGAKTLSCVSSTQLVLSHF